VSEQDELIAEAEIGDAAKQFIESELGKTLLGMAQQELLLAQEELEKVDPTDTKKITALQNQAKTARNFESWLGELVIKGQNAINVWRQQNG
jgi:hypothetical protein